MIDQETWREDLPEPDYERIVHKVKNIIIHHSATSNDLTDYTNVIRNIYLYHTEGNGWSDIGYNYVIAQDGSIFKARDPGIYEQDNVMGAHFCSSNSGTMGICLLGDYMNIYPTKESVNALVNLLAWKAAKDTLNPYDINTHILNPELKVIAGHRDGCSTLCPGDSLYEKLNSVRHETADEMEDCGFFYSSVISSNKSLPEIKILPDPENNKLDIITENGSFKNIYLADISGKVIHMDNIIKTSENHMYINTEMMLPGIYFLIFVFDQYSLIEKIIIY
jgi:hypothetical protein